MPLYQVTGNEYLSLPTIRETDGALEGLTLLHMGAKGLLELNGGSMPLLRPLIRLAGAQAALQGLQWRREAMWIPVASGDISGVSLSIAYLCPIGERGFILRLEAENRTPRPVEVWLGAAGQWTQTLHHVNETLSLCGTRTQAGSLWNGAFVMQETAGLPLCAFAPIAEKGVTWTWGGGAFEGGRGSLLAPGETAFTELFFGVGYETVAAATSAKHLLRLGYRRCHEETLAWLRARELPP